MECPNCAFQNTPGMRSCVRCQSLLDFSGVAIEPPRAGEDTLMRRLRESFYLTRLHTAQRLRRFGDGVQRGFNLRAAAPLFPWGIIPGLGHIRSGARTLGLTLMGIWLALLLAALAVVGSTTSLFLVAAALSLHCFAISLLMMDSLQSLTVSRRLIIGLTIYCILFAGVYLPARWTVRGGFGVLQLHGFMPTDSLQPEHVLLHTGRWTRPDTWNHGDLVVYNIPRIAYGALIVRSGYSVDRIVGLPGDMVVVQDGIVYVNGTPAARDAGPLNPGGLLVNVMVQAGPNEYIILPSAIQWTAYGDVTQILRQVMPQLVRVPEENIVGRAVWRVRPWRQNGPL